MESYLAGHGISPARRQAEDLLGAVLELDRLHLYLEFESVPSPAELGRLRELVRRRAAGEPLQHLLGWQPFLGLRLLCDRRALIPRPETEELARRAAAWLKERQPWSAADLGTGSGCLALALAKEAGEGRMWAVDSSAEALQLAAENARACGLAERVEFLLGDWAAPLKAAAAPPLDLLVSNPPYIPSAEIAGLEPAVRDHEPRAALDGGADGLKDLRLLLATAPGLLKPGGLLAMECGLGQPETLARSALQAGGWASAEALPDSSGRLRYLWALKA
jgi:release factor glutamine methyltransferase